MTFNGHRFDEHNPKQAKSKVKVCLIENAFEILLFDVYDMQYIP